MKTRFAFSCSLAVAVICGLFFPFSLFSQVSFSLEAYQKFLRENRSLTSQELMRLYPTGPFDARAEAKLSSACFGKEIDKGYALTDGEKQRIGQNGFVVTERLSYPSFGEPLVDIFKKDLPVFVSTDAILHPLHLSYDNLLKEMETYILLPKFQQMLRLMHERLAIKAGTNNDEGIAVMLQDADLYLTVARQLLEDNPKQAPPIYPENNPQVGDLLKLIEIESPASYPLFISSKSSPRDIDFSQFRPRGHYTSTPELTRYFKALMWLGRTEIYLTSPKAFGVKLVKEDMQRQTIDGLLLVRLLEESNALTLWKEADGMIRFFVGESDNITPQTIAELMRKTGVADPAELLDTTVWRRFGDALAAVPNNGQAIMSQLLGRSDGETAQVETATAFLLFGQRFIPDSYVLSNVVYDRVAGDPKRMLPSPLDVLFALGNNAAAPLLKNDLEAYSYAPNLAGTRYLIDSYDSAFWNGTFYNRWLNILRTLNPPSQKERNALPRFMRTEAWWRQKMNTQLASWAEMRHDNILYAKQSYSTSYITCSYPKSFVEPVPAFYRQVADLSRRVREYFAVTDRVGSPERYFRERIAEHFRTVEGICDTLAGIADKEVRGKGLSDAEIGFLRSMIREDRHFAGGCGGGGEEIVQYNGWYPRLFYWPDNPKAVTEPDYIVADVHTAPTDSQGNPVGWVLHVGTGPINMAVVTCDSPDGSTCAYVGPVMSYYEHLTTGYSRLNDEEWKGMQSAGGLPRPAWTNLYLVGNPAPATGK